MMYGWVIGGWVLFLLSLAFNVVGTFRFVWKGNSRSRRIAQGVIGSSLAILTGLLLIELFFAFFFARSDPFLHSLAARNWMERYWQVNSLGYRDQEWKPEHLADRTKVVVLGDSVVAGQGIEQESDRFSNLLDSKLGDEYAVMNLGLPGAKTQAQLEAILEYPYPPDILILSMELDDILDTAIDLEVWPPNFVPPSPRLVEESYAMNYFYWQHYQPVPWQWSENYRQWVTGLYQEPGIWATYQSLLLEIIQFTRKNNIHLIVVVFPNFQSVTESRTATDQLVHLYREQNISVLDVAELVLEQDIQPLTINAIDWHPSRQVHQQVAESLYPMVLEIEQETTPP